MFIITIKYFFSKVSDNGDGRGVLGWPRVQGDHSRKAEYPRLSPGPPQMFMWLKMVDQLAKAAKSQNTSQTANKYPIMEYIQLRGISYVCSFG